MSRYRKTAIWVGVLYIVATVAPVSTIAFWGFSPMPLPTKAS